MNVYNKDYLNKIKNDDYFSSVVADFNKEKSIEKYISMCKVLEYRTFYMAYNTSFIDHHLRANFKHTGYLPIEIYNDETKVQSIALSIEVKVQNFKEEVLCIFTDPSKINFKQGNVNTISPITLSKVWEKYFNDEKYGGICINVFNEQIMIPYDYIRFILENKYDEIEKRLGGK